MRVLLGDSVNPNDSQPMILSQSLDSDCMRRIAFAVFWPASLVPCWLVAVLVADADLGI